MKLLLINFSDIHFKSANNSVIEKQDAIISAIRNPAREHDEILILISGDTGFSGSEEEYFIALEFFEKIKSNIEEYTEKKIRVIVIPGNHDCDFKSDTKARKNQIELIQKLGDSAIDASVVKQLAEIQKNYRTFNTCFEDVSTIIYKDEIFTAYEVKYQEDKFKVIFYCYNTSYISELHEQPGKMVFPINILPPLFDSGPADIFISTFHHPFNWYNPINRRDFETHIHETSDFYITGHEHEHSATLISDLDANYVYHLEGTVLQESETPDQSEFNLISFDLEKKDFSYDSYIYTDDKYSVQKGKPRTNYSRGKLKIKSKYEIEEGFKILLDDVGGNFTHPSKSDIKLHDLYVYPKFKKISVKAPGEEDVSVIFEDAESIIKNLGIDSKLIILGHENIGKTALMRTTFRFLHAKGFVPILVNGDQFRNYSFDEIQKVIRRAAENIYGSENMDDFDEENIDNIYLLIDDIDKSPIKNRKARAKFIENISKYYKNLILSGNELFPIEEILIDENSQSELYANFSQYEILEFNYSYRNKLIQRWYCIGITDFQDDSELWKKCDQANKAIQVAMGNKIVPNYPIFILILLQALESATGHNLQLSSYGNYYQLLILKAFSDNIRDQGDLTMYQNYCAELANYFYDEKAKVITNLEFTEFHKGVVSFEKFDLPFLTYEKAKGTLIKIGVLEEWNDQLRFKYPYIYYFFQAKYLSQNISNKEIKKKIADLCLRLHRTEFANIIMFLIHFSKEDFIIEQLLLNAKLIFDDIAPCMLADDIKEIQTVLKEAPKIYLQDRAIEEIRQEEGEAIDRQEETAGDAPHDLQEDISLPDPNEDVSELDLFAKINLGFKLTEILGQVLKNNYGALQGKVKFELLSETYLLGLRLLNAFLNLVTDSTDTLVNQLKTIISEDDTSNNEETAERQARQLLFTIFSHTSFLFLKKIADAVGSPRLLDKYAIIEEKYNFVSVQLANYQIKLDQGSGFPNKELPTLKKDIEQYPLSYFILKQMVRDHLHRNPVDFKDKQRICEFLGIPIQSQLKYEGDRKKGLQ